MKLLFYIEPWVEREIPYMKGGWLQGFSKNIINSLNDYNSDLMEFRIICGDSLKSYLNKSILNLPNNATINFINTDDLLNIFNSTSEATSSWQSHSYTRNQSLSMQGLISDELNDFIPDICVSYSEAPFLQELYPTTKVIYFEYGFISRPPYPKTFSFDVFGTYKNSYLAKNHEELEKFTEPNVDFLDKIKSHFTTIFKNKNIQFDSVEKYRKKYDYLVLLPTQFNGVQGWDSNCEYDSQLNFVCSIMKKIDKKIGVIVTNHPHYPFLIREDIREYLQSTYSNIIIDNEILETINSSQILLTQVDALISISSSIILQSVLLEKPVFIPTTSYLSSFSQNTDISLIRKHLDNKIYKCKKAIMYHLITHYYLPESYLMNGEYLYKYLINTINKKYEQLHYGIYNRIDSDENLLSHYIKESRKDEFLKKRFIKK